MDVLQVVHSTLENGLRVVVLRLPHLHAVAEALLVRTGPRFERPSESGISHMVEHLLFRGTERYPSSASLNIAVEALGGEINGLTQRDATTIHLTVPPRSALSGLALLGEVCTRPRLTGIEIERDVVMEEILDTLDSAGAELDGDTLSRRVLWAGHPIGLPIAGTPATVEALGEAVCRAHYERTFVTENAVLCVAGPVDPEAVLAAAERAFAPMLRGPALPEPPAVEPPRRAPIHVQDMDDPQVSVVLSYPAPHENHPDFAALLLLRRILDDGLGSRLRQAICEERGLAYSVSASLDAYSDLGALDVELSCSARKLCAALEQTLQTLAELRQREVGDEELERVKIRHQAELEFALDDPNEMCGWYGATELVRCPASYEERMAQVLAVTAQDLRRLAERLFDPSAAVLCLVGRVAEKDARRLELLLGREKGSTVWLGEGAAEPEAREA